MATVDYNSNKVKFQWNYEGNRVEVAGNFQLTDVEDWAPIPLEYDESCGKRNRELSLKPDTDYSFKFVVDGNWCYDQGFPSEKDSSGNMNNVLKFEAKVVEPEGDSKLIESNDLTVNEIEDANEAYPAEENFPEVAQHISDEQVTVSNKTLPLETEAYEISAENKIVEEIVVATAPKSEEHPVESNLGLNLSSQSSSRLEDELEITTNDIKCQEVCDTIEETLPLYEIEPTSEHHHEEHFTTKERPNYFDEGVVLGEFTPPPKSKQIEDPEIETTEDTENLNLSDKVQIGQDSKQILETPVVEPEADATSSKYLAARALQAKRDQKNAGKFYGLTTFELVSGFSVLAVGLSVAAASYFFNKYLFNKKPFTKPSNNS